MITNRRDDRRKFMRMVILLAALALPCSPGTACAQAGRAADLKAIRAIETQWEAAWNHHDVPAMVALGAADADWINLAGEWFKGRDAFAKSLESLHSGKVKASVWHTGQVDVKFLDPNIAVVHVYFTSSGERNPNGTAMPARRGIFTRVEMEQDGRWRIVASQATNIVPRAIAWLPAQSSEKAGE
jgi:uncharacterized protein (TIGR02246 family)